MDNNAFVNNFVKDAFFSFKKSYIIIGFKRFPKKTEDLDKALKILFGEIRV